MDSKFSLKILTQIISKAGFEHMTLVKLEETFVISSKCFWV